MDKKIDIIDELTNQLQPAKSCSSPLRIFFLWIIAAALYLTLGGIFMGTRPDIIQKLSTSIFAVEIAALALIIITSGIALSVLAFPDYHQKKWLTYLPTISLVLFIAVISYALKLDNPPSPPPEWHGIECALYISLFSLIPAFLSFYLLKRYATTNRFLAGGICALGASALGCLSLRLEEPTDSIIHLIEWHYIPIIGFVSLGLLVGGKILKW